MGVKPITSLAEFKNIIASDKPVVIDFWATWCGPCKMMSPVFERLSDNQAFMSAGIQFYKVDVDDQGEIAQEVGVKAMPTFVAYVGGKKVKELVGANPGNLEAMVKTVAGV